MGWFNDVVNVIHDFSANSIQPLVSSYNVVTGDNTVKIDYKTEAGILAGQIQGDVVKISAQPLSSSFDSITGYKTDLGYETGVGEFAGGFESGLADGIHAGFKIFANGVSGGLATKLTNSWRDPQNREGDGTALFNNGTQSNVSSLGNNGGGSGSSGSSSFLGGGSIVGVLAFLFLIFLSKRK